MPIKIWKNLQHSLKLKKKKFFSIISPIFFFNICIKFIIWMKIDQILFCTKQWGNGNEKFWLRQFTFIVPKCLWKRHELISFHSSYESNSKVECALMSSFSISLRKRQLRIIQNCWENNLFQEHLSQLSVYRYKKETKKWHNCLCPEDMTIAEYLIFLKMTWILISNFYFYNY